MGVGMGRESRLQKGLSVMQSLLSPRTRSFSRAFKNERPVMGAS